MTCPFLIIIIFHDTPGRLTNSLTCWSFCLRTQSNLTWMRGTSGGFMVLPSVGKRIPSEGDKHPETLCFVIPYFFLGSWCFKMLYWEEKMYIIYTMGNDVVIGLSSHLPFQLSTAVALRIVVSGACSSLSPRSRRTVAFQFTSSAHSEKSLKVDRVMEPAQSLNQKHHLKQAPSLKLKERFVIALQTPRFLSEILILPLRLQLHQPPPPWMEVAKLNRLQSCQPALKVLLPTTRPRRRLASPPRS